ncbi:PIN domain-containing protein [Aquisalimonas sp. 2447]|nr:PIN domain-containing protein [Aquisalimonas sp. 2447]QIT54501.1 PIN domain-containing protein [Aquisalimonas sp. 2447]
MPLLISNANVLIDMEVGEPLERMFALCVFRPIVTAHSD